MNPTKICVSCGRDLPVAEFYALKTADDGLTTRCKACYKAARGSRSTTRQARRTAATKTVTTGTGYVANRDLLQLWEAVVRSGENDQHPLVMMFLGPSGCGKTRGAEYLAETLNIPFTKVDAAAMTDPEAWFGTREVVARDGVAVTVYRPSEFVQAIQRPGIVLIDEINRIRDEHRNIILPLTDATHQVTNPLTGDVVKVDPGCFIIMSGNRGLQFTGTYAVDPALMTRALVVPFDYLATEDEERVLQDRTGVEERFAQVLVRFANETRQRAKADPDMTPVSTRELLAAATLISKGCPTDLAVQVAVINAASDEGGAESTQARLSNIWGGIRPTF